MVAWIELGSRSSPLWRCVVSTLVRLRACSRPKTPHRCPTQVLDSHCILLEVRSPFPVDVGGINNASWDLVAYALVFSAVSQQLELLFDPYLTRANRNPLLLRRHG